MLCGQQASQTSFLFSVLAGTGERTFGGHLCVQMDSINQASLRAPGQCPQSPMCHMLWMDRPLAADVLWLRVSKALQLQ